MKVDDPTKLLTNQIYITTGSGNTFSCSVQGNFIANEWAIVTINRAQFGIAAGSPVWTGVTQFQFRFQDKSTGAINVWLGGVELLADRASTYPSGVFILECDDGYIGQKSYLAPVVGQRGIPGYDEPDC